MAAPPDAAERRLFSKSTLALDRVSLARLAARIIDRMDELDGDPDFEDLRDD